MTLLLKDHFAAVFRTDSKKARKGRTGMGGCRISSSKNSKENGLDQGTEEETGKDSAILDIEGKPMGVLWAWTCDGRERGRPETIPCKNIKEAYKMKVLCAKVEEM